MTLNDHLLLMVDVRLVQCVLEVLPETVAGLDLGVQPRFPLRSVDRGPDAIVTPLNQFGVRSHFN